MNQKKFHGTLKQSYMRLIVFYYPKSHVLAENIKVNLPTNIYTAGKAHVEPKYTMTHVLSFFSMQNNLCPVRVLLNTLKIKDKRA